jgi:hypothetical protein
MQSYRVHLSETDPMKRMQLFELQQQVDEFRCYWGDKIGSYSMYAFSCGVLAVWVGGTKMFFSISSNSAESSTGFNILSIGIGSLLIATSVAFSCSSKLQAFIGII